MVLRLALEHTLKYTYGRPVRLGPQVLRMRPQDHYGHRLVSFGVTANPISEQCNWQYDPYGNQLARFQFPDPVEELTFRISSLIELSPRSRINEKIVDPGAVVFPFRYSSPLEKELAPWLSPNEAGPRMLQFIERLPNKVLPTIEALGSIAQLIATTFSYSEQAPLDESSQSYDTEALLVLNTLPSRYLAFLTSEVLRNIGLAARVVSGYVVPQKNPETTCLRAWAEAYIPGVGWIGLDPVDGVLTNEFYIPLSAAPSVALTQPLAGTVEHPPEQASSQIRVQSSTQRASVIRTMLTADDNDKLEQIRKDSLAKLARKGLDVRATLWLPFQSKPGKSSFSFFQNIVESAHGEGFFLSHRSAGELEKISGLWNLVWLPGHKSNALTPYLADPQGPVLNSETVAVLVEALKSFEYPQAISLRTDHVSISLDGPLERVQACLTFLIEIASNHKVEIPTCLNGNLQQGRLQVASRVKIDGRSVEIGLWVKDTQLFERKLIQLYDRAEAANLTPASARSPYLHARVSGSLYARTRLYSNFLSSWVSTPLFSKALSPNCPEADRFSNIAQCHQIDLLYQLDDFKNDLSQKTEDTLTRDISRLNRRLETISPNIGSSGDMRTALNEHELDIVLLNLASADKNSALFATTCAALNLLSTNAIEEESETPINHLHPLDTQFKRLESFSRWPKSALQLMSNEAQPFIGTLDAGNESVRLKRLEAPSLLGSSKLEFSSKGHDSRKSLWLCNGKLLDLEYVGKNSGRVEIAYQAEDNILLGYYKTGTIKFQQYDRATGACTAEFTCNLTNMSLGECGVGRQVDPATLPQPSEMGEDALCPLVNLRF